MYAVIRTGGKQFRVAPGDLIKVEKLPGDAGGAVTLDEVLAIGDDKGFTVGTPLLDGASVAAEVVEQTRGPKLIVFKKKRRKNYRRKTGHRQDLTVLRITDIQASGAKKAAAKTARQPSAEAAPEKKSEAKAAKPKETAASAAKPKTAKPKTAKPKAAKPKETAASAAKPARKKAPAKASAKKPSAKPKAKPKDDT